MLGRREFIDRLAMAVAGTMLGAALAWRGPRIENESAGDVVAFKREVDFLPEPAPARLGSWVCNAKRLEEMRAVFSGPDVGSLWFNGSPLVVSEYALPGGPYWVPDNRPAWPDDEGAYFLPRIVIPHL